MAEPTYITEDFLRKKAEHNEGMLSTLEEITLHQHNITRLENLDKFCRHLKILYLQNNLIPKIENVSKLKELEYLNLAVNNVSKIEGLGTCESLYKLDLTLNFIDLDTFKDSIEHLALCPSIKELVLTGNPCTDWKDYKDYIIAKIPQLRRLDSDDIIRSMQIKAEQRLDELEKTLEQMAEEVAYKKEHEPHNPKAYSAENRLKDYEDGLEQKRQQEANKPKNPFEVDDEFKNKKKGPPEVYHENGDIRQCNEGRYKFKITEDDSNDRILVELFLPKFLTTDLVDCDINPLYVRFEIKGKITQLKLPEEVEVDKSKVQRSKATGAITVECPTVFKRPRNTEEYKKEREEFKKKAKMAQLEQEMQNKLYIDENTKKELEEVRNGKEPTPEMIKTEEPYEPDFDLDELPDLE